MSYLNKFARFALVAGFAGTAAAGSAAAQQLKIDGGASLNLQGKVNSQVAAAIGAGSVAHNVVGGVTSGGGLSIGKATINARGHANSQAAFALGVGSMATNNVGGVLAAGALTAR